MTIYELPARHIRVRTSDLSDVTLAFTSASPHL